jgi:Flp pilus assembly protein CpaB
MNIARVVVLTIALGAGGMAAYLASGGGADSTLRLAEPVVQLHTVDVLVAKSDSGPGQPVGAEDLQWQPWPAADPSNSFIRRNERPDAPTPERSETLARARRSGTLALRSIADVNMVENNADDQTLKHSGGINVIRYGVSTPTTTQK